MRKKVLLMSFVVLGPAVMHLHASLSKKQAGMVWTKTAFSPSNIVVGMPSLYLGADTIAPGSENLALARASLSVAAGAPVVKIDPLAPTNATNDAILLNNVKANSPFNNQKITNIALQDSIYPVVTIDQTIDQNVYLVTKPDDGTRVLKNDVAINDAGGNPTKEVKALASGIVTVDPITKAQRDLIFAAVSQTAKDWQDAAGTDRGIAILEKDASNTKLNILDATDFSKANKAKQVSLAATDKVVAFVDAGAGTPAKLTKDVNMFFDQPLQRLYVGLIDATRTNDATAGGVLGVFMGRADATVVPAGELKLQPVVNGVAQALFYDAGSKNVNDRVVGFFADGVGTPGGGDPFTVAIKQINTMHTSTGKDYLVVNSKVVGKTTDKDAVGVCALPLLPAIKIDGKTPMPADQIGTISKVVAAVPTFNEPPTAFNEMPTFADVAVKVGGDAALPLAPLTQDIFVEGDTVYMCTAPAKIAAGSNLNSGIFSSTAIFDQKGAIRAWTPIQRVMGSIEAVFGGGLDTHAQPGDFYALTSESLVNDAALANVNTVKITQWGTSNSVTAQNATVNNLSSVLSTLFPLEKGGLLGLFSFDQKTPGFLEDEFAMMAAVGLDKIALIQTASLVGGQFTLTQNFIADSNDANQNVFVFDGSNPTAPNFSQALADIAPLTSAEVARMTVGNSGWLFVGGCKGVAVLSLVNGDGWDAATGLSALSKANANSFPGGANFTFKKLDDFMNVRKLVAAGGRMYVETLNDIFFFDMVAAKFDGVPTTPLGQLPVAGLNGALIADLVVLSPDATKDPDDNRGVIATNQGVIASNLREDPNNTQKTVAQIGDLALQLQLVGDLRSKAPTTGNVYALATDFENNNDKLYRYDVPDVTVANIDDLVKIVGSPDATGLTEEFNDTVQSFMTDGTFVYTTLPKNYGSTNYLTLTNVDGTGSADVTPLLGLDLNKNTYISGVLRDGASGAIMVPGDWGVRVNE